MKKTDTYDTMNIDSQNMGFGGDFFRHFLHPGSIGGAGNVGELTEELPEEDNEGEEYTDDDPDNMADYAAKNFGKWINRRIK